MNFFGNRGTSGKYLLIQLDPSEPCVAYKILDSPYLCKGYPDDNFPGIFDIESIGYKIWILIGCIHLTKIKKLLTKSIYISSKSTEQ